MKNITSNVEEIKRFIANNNDGVVFSTYHSFDKVAEAAKSLGMKFDLAVLDESHETAGRGDKFMAKGLSDSNLEIDHRLFLTATPRVFSSKLRSNPNQATEVSLAFDMNDESVYGPIAHRMTFGQAIDQGLITDYKVIGVRIDPKKIFLGKLGKFMNQLQIMIKSELKEIYFTLEL